MQGIIWAAGGTGFTFLMTVLGAAVVFCLRRAGFLKANHVFLSFAAGVMLAASVWSLILPALERSNELHISGLLPAAGGITLGALFLVGMEAVIARASQRMLAHTGGKDTTLLLLAITLHNIPEGMAVGLSFALAALSGASPAAYSGAMALALGIGVQNFPEGAAVSLPLYQEGFSKRKSFLYGTLSGAVEPLFGILAVLFASGVRVMMPWLLSFAAGAMIYVTVRELIPQAQSADDSPRPALFVLMGFLVMMALDVALG